MARKLTAPAALTAAMAAQQGLSGYPKLFAREARSVLAELRHIGFDVVARPARKRAKR